MVPLSSEFWADLDLQQCLGVQRLAAGWGILDCGASLDGYVFSIRFGRLWLLGSGSPGVRGASGEECAVVAVGCGLFLFDAGVGNCWGVRGAGSGGMCPAGRKSRCFGDLSNWGGHGGILRTGLKCVFGCYHGDQFCQWVIRATDVLPSRRDGGSTDVAVDVDLTLDPPLASIVRAEAFLRV